MTNIINALCNIPENMGWAMAGIVIGFAAMAMWKVVKLIADEIAERLVDDWDEMED